MLFIQKTPEAQSMPKRTGKNYLQSVHHHYFDAVLNKTVARKASTTLIL